MTGSTLALLLSAAAGGAGAIGNTISNKKKLKADAATTAAELQAQKDLANQRVAADESMADPFRQQMHQATDIGKLDRMERGTYKPVHLAAAPGYESYVPEMSGGFSYEKSPEMISSAAALKRNVMSGAVAPTMTNPANYDKTAALNLVKIAADGVDPATVSASGYRPGVSSRPSGVTPNGRALSTPGYAPAPEGDLSANWSENHATLAGAGKGAMMGAGAAKIAGPFTALGGALIGSTIGAILSRSNETKNQREDFAQSLGLPDTAALWQHLQQTLPPNVAAELQTRALTRIGKHDKTANAQWMQDVQAALAAQQQPQQTGMQPSYAGHG